MIFGDTVKNSIIFGDTVKENLSYFEGTEFHHISKINLKEIRVKNKKK